MGQGPHFKFKPVVHSPHSGQTEHILTSRCCGLFILVTTARLAPPVTREEEAAV